MKKVIIILLLSLSFAAISDKHKKEPQVAEPKKIQYSVLAKRSQDIKKKLSGLWTMYKHSNGSITKAYLGIWHIPQTSYYNVFLYEDDPSVTEEEKKFHGCTAPLEGADIKTFKLNCNGGKIIIAPILPNNGGKGVCENIRKNEPDERHKKGVAKYDEQLPRIYNQAICYVIYQETGPGEGSGTAGNTGGN